jgi:alkylresorcinol/alkylpyrone synthase
VLEQAEVARRAARIFGATFERFPQLAEVFTHAGIARRHAVRPIDWYEQPHGWPERTEAYLDGAGALYVEAATAALARAGVEPEAVGTVVTISSTGIATPSLEARVGRRLGLSANVARVPVFGLGCAGGVTGLSLAARLARATPGRAVLVVAVELCTLAFRQDRSGKADVVTTALFGDGAAAAVLQAGDETERGVRVGLGFEHTWPDTLDIMGWSVDPLGFGVILSRALPRFVEDRLASPARAFLEAAGLTRENRFVCHPGGAKVLTAVEAALGMQPDTLRHERAVLRDFGNMSAPTVLFVLERVLAEGLTGSAVLAALGPGFTASFLALDTGHA